ncbi:hypothetical protein [Wocania ichthyoenteri]|uniref:hypothetical protein n=1 Tax=Wocania ichthyoenteri TaxID=1230531 RepID=UPI00053E7ED5|nr:hypothetical protein [Wocania ichthyoenteri]
MKIKLLGFVLITLLVSCQNEIIDNREDWVKEIDETIMAYEKTAKIESTKTLMENGIESVFDYYQKDSNGFQKIKGTYKDEFNLVDAILELYVLNEEIVLEKMSGLFPLLYKGEKKEIDPCCELFNRFIYYKNSLEGKAYTKQLKIMNGKDKEKYINDLNMLPLIEEEGFNIANEYWRTKNQIKELKEEIKNN